MSGESLEEYLPSALPREWVDLVGSEGLDFLAGIGHRIDSSLAEKNLLTPHPSTILRAFETPPQSVKALIIGQDPYPGAGHASGLAFSVDRSVRPLPRSLLNIRKEYQDDLGLTLPPHGDLSRWAENGVLLLNRHPSTLVGVTGAHRALGWSGFTGLVVERLAETGQFFVPILWGKDARGLSGLMGDRPRIESAHPSPLSVRLGFFGSRPFSRANQYCDDHGVTRIDWSLEDEG